MKTIQLITLFILTTFLVSLTVSKSYSQEADQLFQKGLMKENGEGNLQEAIQIYDQVVSDEAAENAIKAKAQLHIGMCYEKLGKEEAIKAYELVLQNYTNYEDEVQLANMRLSGLRAQDSEDLAVIKLFEDGSSMENSSLSPDGTKLAGVVFNEGQNIAVYDRIKNENINITGYDWTSAGHGWTYYPVWSPDGKEIAYEFGTHNGQNHEIRISDLAGKTRTIYESKFKIGQIISRQWSLDGSTILTFMQDTAGAYTIGLIPAKGGDFKPLYETQWVGRFAKGDASLSPDGKYIVFADGAADNMDIFIIDTEGGQPYPLSDYPAMDKEPLWSPDGKHIAFIRETKGEALLYAIEMADGKPVGKPALIKEGMQNAELTNWTSQGIAYNLDLDFREMHTVSLDPETGTPVGEPKLVDFTPTGSNICPVWSHDGKNLAFISYDEKPEVVILPAEGGKAIYYAITIPEFWAAAIFDLRWLPDNSGVGFSNVNSLSESIAYRLDIATGKWQEWPLPIKSWARTEFGPDKNSLVYNNRIVPIQGLYQHNTKTGTSQNIFQPEDSEWYTIRGLKFSRDHKKLAFTFQNSENGSKLILLDLESGESHEIGQNFGIPTFSPDGQKVMALGKSSISIISLDGEILQEYNLLEHFTSGTRIHSLDWSPDGKLLVFSTVYWTGESYLMKNVLK